MIHQKKNRNITERGVGRIERYYLKKYQTNYIKKLSKEFGTKQSPTLRRIINEHKEWKPIIMKVVKELKK